MGNRIVTILAFLLFVASSFLIGASFSPTGAREAGSPVTSKSNLPLEDGKPLPVADVVERVKPAVVLISVQSKPNSEFSWHPTITDSGTGLIFDPAGYIITNDHVIASKGNSEITVTLLDKRKFTAQVIGRDQTKDLAVIKIQSDNLPVANFGNSDEVRVGDWVIAIGNALDLDGGPSATMGIVSALDRSINSEGQGKLFHLIQTDASINPGNSGGPLVGLDGAVIGINAAVAQDAQGIGFAIPGNVVRSMANEAISKSGAKDLLAR